MRKVSVLLSLALVLGTVLASTDPAQADHRHRRFSFGVDLGGAYFYYERGPAWSPYYFSRSYDIIYHPTSLHWTPDIGWHTHGHYHVVPRDYFYVRPYRPYGFCPWDY
ncbi:MAG: hypothetical protein C4297_06310 [Gemmataceae bacterium]